MVKARRAGRVHGSGAPDPFVGRAFIVQVQKELVAPCAGAPEMRKSRRLSDVARRQNGKTVALSQKTKKRPRQSSAEVQQGGRKLRDILDRRFLKLM